MASDMDDGGRCGVPARSASRAFDVLDYLSGRAQPASSGAIGLACGIPKSSLHNLLNVLKDRRLITHHPTSHAWSLGPRLFELVPGAPLLAQGLAVLRAFDPSSGALTIREIGARAGLSQSVVRSVIPLMVEADLLWTQPDGSYRLGLEIFSLAARVGWTDRLRAISRPVLTQLRDSTRETANLAVADGDMVIYIDQVESRQALRFGGWIGRRIRLDGSALGEAMRQPGVVSVRNGAVEEGVMAIACCIEGVEPAAAVSVLAPTWRIERWGIDSGKRAVAAAARQLSDLLASSRPAAGWQVEKRTPPVH